MTNLNIGSHLSSTPAPRLPRKIQVFVIGPSGGGVRKTKTTLALGATCTAAGRRVAYICADRGIGSLSRSLKAGGPNPVEFLPGKEENNYSETILAYAEAENADVIIIDLGASELLNAKSRRTVLAALTSLRAGGHDTYVLLSLTPGKVGLEDDAATFARPMTSVAEVILVFHGRDEGGDLRKFDDLTEEYRSIYMPSDQQAILDLVTEAECTPFDWCSAPPKGFKMAAAMMAHNLLQLSKESVVRDILGCNDGIPKLVELSKGAPRRVWDGRNARWEVHDAALRADEVHLFAQDELLKLHRTSTDNEVLRAARALINANADCQDAYAIAKLATS